MVRHRLYISQGYIVLYVLLLWPFPLESSGRMHNSQTQPILTSTSFVASSPYQPSILLSVYILLFSICSSAGLLSLFLSLVVRQWDPICQYFRLFFRPPIIFHVLSLPISLHVSIVQFCCRLFFLSPGDPRRPNLSILFSCLPASPLSFLCACLLSLEEIRFPLFACLSLCLSLCISMYLSLSLFPSASLCLSLSLSLSLCFSLSVSVCLYLSISLSSLKLSVYRPKFVGPDHEPFP